MLGEKSFFDQMSSKFAFFAGVICTIAVVSLIGFIVLLGILFNGRTTSGTVGDAPTPPSGPADDGPRDVTLRAVSNDDHSRGDKNAKVAIVEYSDLECPFCKRFHEPMQQLLAAYPKDVRWVYRHFPLDQLHSKARAEAEAAECAAEQGKFWEFIDKIYTVTPSNDGLNLDDLPKFATEVGVRNINKFNECRSSGKYREKVQADLDDAIAAGGRGTPYSVVLAGDQKIPLDGAYSFDQLKQVVEQFK